MWITRFWIFLIILALVAGVAVWAVFFKPSQAVAEVMEVAKVVERVVTVEVEKKVEVPKEVTRVVEKIVKETVVVTPVPTLPSLKESASSLVAATTQVTGTGQITATSVVTQGAWTISYFPGSTQEMLDWKFQDPNPKAWSIFPNVTNTVASKVYPAAWLLEYGQDTDFTCQSVGCFFVVPAGEYRMFSGDYAFPEIDQWLAKDDTGSAIMFVNVGNQTAEWEALLKRGFTYRGRYWWGEHLPEAVWAGMSHAAYRMLNLSGETANAGANCSNRDGCPRVRLTFVIVSGHEILMKATAFVSR